MTSTNWDAIRSQVRHFHSCSTSTPLPHVPRDFTFSDSGSEIYFLATSGGGNSFQREIISTPELSGCPKSVENKLLSSKSYGTYGRQLTLCVAKLSNLQPHDRSQEASSNSKSLSESNAAPQASKDLIKWSLLLPSNWTVVQSAASPVSSKEEQLMMERKRISNQGILSYERFVSSKTSEDEKFLFPYANSLFCGSLDKDHDQLDISAVTAPGAGTRVDAKLGSKSGDLVAFTRDGDIWVTSMDGVEQQLTFRTTPAISNGIAEYIMQEEFRRFTGYWWRPALKNDTSRFERILYLEVDETGVEWVFIARPGAEQTDIDRYRYPRVGKPNASAIPKIVEFAAKGKKRPVQLSLQPPYTVKELFPWMEYIVRAGWLPDSKSVWLQLLDRTQKQTAVIRIPEELFVADGEPLHTSANSDISKSAIHVLYEEVSPYWINISDSFRFLSCSDSADVPSNIAVNKTQSSVLEFIWSSERTGFRHLYHITSFLDVPSSMNYQQIVTEDVKQVNVPVLVHPRSLTRQITMGEWQVVDNPIFVDQSRSLVYYMGKKDTPIENHMYVSCYSPETTLSVPPFSAKSILYPNESVSASLTPAYLENNNKRLTSLGMSHSGTFSDSCDRFVSVSSSIRESPRTQLFVLHFPDERDGENSDLQEHRCDVDRPDTDEPTRGTHKEHHKVYMTRKRTQKTSKSDHPTVPLKRTHSQANNTQPTSSKRRPPNYRGNSIEEFRTFLLEDVFPTAQLVADLFPPEEGPPTLSADCLDEDDESVYHKRALIYAPLPVPEIFSFINSDGVKIYGIFYKPLNWREGESYPTILRIYGGPNVQVIMNDFKYPKFNRLFMALKFGFSILMVDSRGSYGRGLLFESYIQHSMGTVELKDQIEALLYLATNGQLMFTRRRESKSGHTSNEELISLWEQVKLEKSHGRYNGFIDMNRIAVTGWSYGGYLSLMALCHYPTIFKMSLAGAPVTNWEFYDTAYTERYMGLLQENREGYSRGNVLEYVNRFPDSENRLLIVHGLIDENVHFKNTEALVSGLAKHSKPHQVQVYPSERHGLRAAHVIEHFETLMFWWFLNHL